MNARQGRLRALVDTSPRRGSALAALAAAGLATLGSLVLLGVGGGDFGLGAGDRLRLSTADTRFAVAVLLALALSLRRSPEPGSEPEVDDRWFGTAAMVVGAGASLLVLGRAVADLVSPATGPFVGGGASGRIGTVLVDLAALLVTAVTTWWAFQVHTTATPSPDRG